MKYIHLYLTYFLCLITSLIYTGCKDDESELIPNTFEISSSDLNKEIDFRSTTMSIPVKTNLRTSQWSVNSDEKWATAFQQDDKIMLSILDNQGKTKRYAKLAVKSELGNYTINLTQYGVNDVDFRNDTQIAIVSGNAISQGDNWSIEKTFDGIKGSQTQGDGYHYHSPWDNTTHPLPIDLEYTLQGDKQVDYFIYYPRNGNGNFGAVDVYVQSAVFTTDYYSIFYR